jgi:hypothetical protein
LKAGEQFPTMIANVVLAVLKRRSMRWAGCTSLRARRNVWCLAAPNHVEQHGPFTRRGTAATSSKVCGNKRHVGVYAFERTNGQTPLGQALHGGAQPDEGIDQKTALPIELRSGEGYPGLFGPAKPDHVGPYQETLPIARGRQQLLVGTIQPKDAAPLHFVAADLQRKRSGIGPILWNLLESPLLVAEPKQVRPPPLAPIFGNCALTVGK